MMKQFQYAAFIAAVLAGAAFAAPAQAGEKAPATVPAWDKTQVLDKQPGAEILPDEEALFDEAEGLPKDSPQYKKIMSERAQLEAEQGRLRRQIDHEFDLLQKSPLQ